MKKETKNIIKIQIKDKIFFNNIKIYKYLFFWIWYKE